jgi:oligopeptide transport system substrate-binding protein
VTIADEGPERRLRYRLRQMVTRFPPALGYSPLPSSSPAAGARRRGRSRSAPSAASPRIANPNREPLDPPSAILLEAAAQGLVRFDSGGEIEPALAQRWIVSDDGLRYTFRLGKASPGPGRPDHRRAGRRAAPRRGRAVQPQPRQAPILGAIDEIVAMTDDVLEISLKSPRPNFLQLLAQPEMAIVRGGEGSGPYRASSGGRTDRSGASRREPRRRRAPPRRRSCFAARARPRSPRPGSAPARPISSSAERSATCRWRGRFGRRRRSFASIRWPACSASPSPRRTGPSPDRRSPGARHGDRPAGARRRPGRARLQPRESLLPPGIEGLAQVSAPAWIRDPLPDRQARAAA